MKEVAVLPAEMKPAFIIFVFKEFICILKYLIQTQKLQGLNWESAWMSFDLLHHNLSFILGVLNSLLQLTEPPVYGGFSNFLVIVVILLVKLRPNCIFSSLVRRSLEYACFAWDLYTQRNI